jgi:catechol 2,3-dioxygenase-like lactoylglutathione lyase family enzyme
MAVLKNPPKAMWHVAVPTTDVPRAKKFYEEVLGLAILPESKRRTRPASRFNYEWYDMGETEFHVGEKHPSLTIDTEGKINPTLAIHVAFEVEDIEATKRDLAAAGIDVIDMSAIRGNMQLAKQCFVFDPDGNMIELAERVR